MMLVPAFTQEEELILNTLSGVGYQNDADMTGLSYLSMAGGAPMTIAGQDMASTPELNTIMFVPTWLENVVLYGPKLSSDNEFNSNAMAGRIAYSSPTPMELFNAPYDAFNGETLPYSGGADLATFFVEIQNNDDNHKVMCGSANNCRVKYNKDYTAQLLDVTPANVYKGQLAQFHLNGRSVSRTECTPADAWPFREIRLGATLVDWEDLVTQDQRLTQWNLDTFEALVGDQSPTSNSEPKLLMQNGYAMNTPTTQHCNFAGDDCWTVRTHPKIESVSASSGFTTGGQLFTVSGHGLNGTDISVLIDGVACEVTQNASGSINCVTGASTSASALGYQPGQPGLKREKTDADGTYSVSDLVTSMEIFETGDDVYKEQVSGWFTAPTTGQYRFYLSCNDACNLYLDSANPYQGTPLDVKPEPELIAYRYWSSSWRNYFYNLDEGQRSV